MDKIKKINRYALGQIDKYCEAVYTGSKPCALFTIQKRYVKEVIEFINNFRFKKKKLLIYKEKARFGWVTIYIYLRPFLLEVIKNSPEHPETVYEHWVLGKLFGYSDEAIEEYLKHGQSNYCIIDEEVKNG